VVARLAEVGKAWTPPPPLERIPDSWANWPVPSSVLLFTGQNIAKDKSARCFSGGQIKSAAPLVDGDPRTASDGSSPIDWWEVDLGASYPLAGLHIWNQATVGNAMLERGHILVSEQPFEADGPEQAACQPGVKAIAITEAPGYPTPYVIGVRGRYVRIVPDNARKLSIGEVEVFTENR
jgi:hypothetical protein